MPPKNSASMLTPSEEYLVWIDCEMTGLNLQTDQIIEIACLITTKDLKVLDKGVRYVVHVNQTVLDSMGPWCKKQHYQSGLWDQCLKSSLSLNEIDRQLRKYIEQHMPNLKGRAVLAGNSVYTDKMFINKDLPSVAEYFHYRLVDVSSIKELAKRWKPELIELAKPSSRPSKHRAFDDILDSISELCTYRQHFFVCPEKQAKDI
ncbi:hypothetical protein O181_028004 [Austropuccinia psidii MF-1]|uniref:Exonuclease domain-containing protein n=1 Tax=Austropuccinia psidii MF-1 TaxID=1389203 RepID=A0A9Q3H357_9BASI|nr:hypothetical protein [Austropuccinia psidii MF-1]